MNITLGIMKKGISSKIHQTGYMFVLPFGFQEVYRLPKNIQIMELTNNRQDVSPRKTYQKAAYIQTSDGFYVTVDVSILYRITDAYKVITTLGPDKAFIINGLAPRSEPALKRALGELTTEEFYNSPLRVEATQKAKDLLNKELKSKGIEVEHVLVRYFEYDEEIQKNIEDRKLKDQLVFRNQAEARAAEENAKLKKVVEEGEAAVRVRLAEGRAYERRKNAEKELYVRSKRSDADLLVELAKAKRQQLKNEALKSKGSDRRVALEMAEVMEGVEFIMLPSTGEAAINPLDLDGMLNTFGVANE